MFWGCWVVFLSPSCQLQVLAFQTPPSPWISPPAKLTLVAVGQPQPQGCSPGMMTPEPPKGDLQQSLERVPPPWGVFFVSSPINDFVSQEKDFLSFNPPPRDGALNCVLGCLAFPCKSIMVVQYLWEALHTSVPQLKSCWWKAPCYELRGYMAGRCKWKLGDEEANTAGLGRMAVPPPLPGPCRATRSKTH